MDAITIRQGETLQIPVTINDTSAETVRFVVADENGAIVIDITENFTVADNKATATILTNETLIETGEYSYQLVVTYSDDVVDILPDASECQGDDCELPKLIVCESLLFGVS